MTAYVVYVASNWNLERFKSFKNENDAVECAKRLSEMQKGKICVYKEVVEKIFTA